MKSPLLAGVTALTFVALTATTLYAQVAGGTSIVDKMKAAAHSFTLSSILNPTDTGLTSEPLKGKKTGDILTAGEYNRILELVSEGGGSGGSGWVDVPLTDTNPFDYNGCQYRVKLTGPAYNTGAGFSADGYFSSDYVTAGVLQLDSGIFIKSGTKNIVYVMDQSNGAIVEVTTAWGWRPTKIEKLCGGGAGGFLSLSCPAGFTLIGSGAGSFCISTASETPTTYAGAMEACYQKNAELCDSMDWYAACRANETSKAILQGMGGATLEMTSTAAYSYNVIAMGSGGSQTAAGYFISGSKCETRGYVLDVRNNNSFRCCIQ